MAVVYRAIEKATLREVAIKLLPPTEIAIQTLPQEFVYDKQRLDRFMREANMLKMLCHENIVEILEIGENKGYHYYVMEYVKGLSIADILEEAVCLEENWALEIIKNVAKALAHAWQNKIVHRDIKTDNIMVTEDGSVKLFDYGLAKSMGTTLKESRLTNHDVILGTPMYMAPEQTGLLRGKEIDIRTDIYSLGVTLYDMIMGFPPYYDESPIKLMVMHFKEKIPFARDLRPSISEETSYLIQIMMAKNPDDRFSHPEELIGAIEQMLQSRN
jgi:serine/threonine-protein kinase